MEEKENSINPLPNTNNGLSKSRISVIVSKILKISVLGYFYFFITGMSVALSESCGASDCKFLGIGWAVGAIWMLISFFITTLLIIQNKKFRHHLVVFMPYVAIPIFITVITSSVLLDTYFHNQNIQQQVSKLPVHRQTESDGKVVKWVTYNDTIYGYSIDYPLELSDFKGYWAPNKYNKGIEGKRVYDSMVTFGPESVSGVWSVTVVDKNNIDTIRKSIDELIKNDSEGCKWMNCTENRKNISLNATTALLVTNPVEKDEDFNPRVYIENQNYIYIIRGPLLPEFEIFLNSFVFAF